MLSTVFLGIYLNLSIWYKLSDQTTVGLFISLIGAGITIIINYLFIPMYGYWASTIATLVTFFTMMIISYLWGKIKYPIPYHLGKILTYLTLSSGLGFISFYYFRTNFIIGNLMFIGFIIFVIFREKVLFKKFFKG